MRFIINIGHLGGGGNIDVLRWWKGKLKALVGLDRGNIIRIQTTTHLPRPVRIGTAMICRGIFTYLRPPCVPRWRALGRLNAQHYSRSWVVVLGETDSCGKGSGVGGYIDLG